MLLAATVVTDSHLARADAVVTHCIGLVWKDGGEIDLFSLLHENHRPYANLLSFSSSNSELPVTAGGVLSFGKKDPKDLKPEVSLIQLHYKPTPNTDIVFDRLWVVVNRSDAQAIFDAWYTANSDISWTENLPKPFAKISLATNQATGVVLPIDPEHGAPDKWGAPHVFNSFLHHNAAYEMRSHPIPGGHGHQAMYDAAGKLIIEPIAAGSADLFAPYKKNEKAKKSRKHRDHDVYPFIRALQLDGNPVQKIGKIVGIDAPQNLDRPAIYKGINTDKYTERRPVLP